MTSIFTIIGMHAQIWIYSAWLVIYLCCVFLIYRNRGRWKQGFRAWGIFLLLDAILVYSPIMAKIMVPRFIPTYVEYARLSWTFFIIPVIAYTFTNLIDEREDKRSRMILAVLLLAVIFVNDNRYNGECLISIPENIYKIPQESVEIANSICATTDDKQVSVAVQLLYDEEQAETMTDNGELYYGIRQYASKLTLTPVYVVEENCAGDDEALTTAFGGQSFPFFICEKKPCLMAQAEAMGYKTYLETDHFMVYQGQE